jgi:hypothetical protein
VLESPSPRRNANVVPLGLGRLTDGHDILDGPCGLSHERTRNQLGNGDAPHNAKRFYRVERGRWGVVNAKPPEGAEVSQRGRDASRRALPNNVLLGKFFPTTPNQGSHDCARNE